MNRAQQFKKNPKQREVRVKELNLERKNQRNLLLGELRKIEESPQSQQLTNKSPKKKKSRLELLKEWKIVKQLKENNQKNVKKPPFYVGRIQRTATGSPKVPLKQVANSNTQNRVTTRAQLKKNINTTKPLSRLNKAGNSGLNPVENHLFVLPKGVAALQKEVGNAQLTFPMSPKITKSARKSLKPVLTDVGGEFPKPLKINFSGLHTLSSYKKQRSSIFPNIPELPKKKLDLFDERISKLTISHDLESSNKNNKTEKSFHLKEAVHKPTVVNIEEEMDYSAENVLRVTSNFEHLVFSPLIEKKRGSQRRISSATKKLYCVDDDIKQEEIIKNSRIQSFRLFLTNETNRLLSLSEHWYQIGKVNKEIPSDVEGDINAVVGKTKLLTSDKFKQFEGLINRCEEGDSLIKVDDLQGFHDWVSLEIEDLDKTFFALKESQQKNWVSSPKNIVVKKPCKVLKPLNKKPAATSNMRALIMAARKQMKTNASPDKNCVKENEKTPGLTSPSSTRHEACLSTPIKPNLRVKVLKRCSGLALINATLKARLSQSPIKPATPKLPLGNSLNMSKTPTKSILRLTPAPISEKKTVLFGLDPIYLRPAQDSPLDESPDILQLIENTTPLRRSSRLISKSPGTYKS